jgi:type IV fimbrial biogenesis protein FimT
MPYLALGYSLIEVLVALALLSILLTLAAPGMKQLITSNRSTAYGDELVRSFELARSTAIARRTKIEVCTLGNGNSCRSNTDADWRNWHKGWMVRATPGNEVLAVHGALGEGTAVTGSSGAVEFDASGGVSDSVPQQYWLRFTNCSRKEDRLIEVNASGRVSINATDCSIRG